MELLASLVRQVSPMWVIGGFLAFFSLLFFFDFVVRRLFLGRQLNLAIAGLKRSDESAGRKVTDLSSIATGPMKIRLLAHAWKEYEETLHPESERGATGEACSRFS